MHIAVAAPATLSMFETRLGEAPDVPGYPFPGTSLLVEEYLRLGHQVTLVTTSPGLDAPTHFRAGNLDIRVVRSRPRARSRASDLFRSERKSIAHELAFARPDVIHAHWTYEFALAAQSLTVPLLITIHDWAPEIARQNRHVYWRIRALMQWMCLRGRGTFTAPSSYLATFAADRGVQCTVVPNGIDMQNPAAPMGSVKEPIVTMLNVGFSSRKNVSVALRAWPRVLQVLPAARLRLAGPDYEPGGSAHSWAKEHGLTSGVDFVGPITPSEVPAFLTSGRCFFHASLEESFGLAAVEAMHAGLPVMIGRESGALPEVVSPAGVLVDVRDELAVAEGLVSLVTKPDSWVQERAALGRQVVQRYRSDAVALRFESLLKRLVESDSGSVVE